jgi:ubiquinol-cytochrome c reductase cytochrome c1 subunit
MSRLWLCLFLVVSSVQMAQAEVTLRPIAIDLQDQGALQRGSALFMNYCAGCHSLRYMRYNRMAADLGIPVYSLENSMPSNDARQWFGRVPPDLSLSARERGPAWLYTYLKSFYADKNRPFGVNNALVLDVAMPNSLEPLQAVLSEQQFDRDLQDLITFLVYVAEPAQLIRHRMGFFVILFLCLILLVAYPLKINYWRRVLKN